MSYRLALGIILHFHQPIGSPSAIVNEAYNRCYAPLLALFEQHPTIKVNLHYTGSLLEWIEQNHPEFLRQLALLVRRRQVELLTGGYYDPILPIIPESDQQGQITRLSTFLRQQLGANPQGIWLTQQIWEPNLPSVLAHAGIRYTIVDDTHFQMAGFAPETLYGHYITEDMGNAIIIFPNHRIARCLVPWKPINTYISTLQGLAREAKGKPRIVTMADDGEKFGVWPDTFTHLWVDKGMERLMEQLESSIDWLKTVHLSDYIDTVPPIGRVYLPSAAFTEMMEWALPSDVAARLQSTRQSLISNGDTHTAGFIRGGTWRNFTVKYPETNNFHKKMLRVHHKLDNATPHLETERRQEALTDLWRGQCNSGYWHGISGGAYVPSIRSAIYRSLIQAEKVAESAQPRTTPIITLTDFDCDGHDELLVETRLMNVYMAPIDGGTIFEWDWKENPFNVVDTMARRPELYHRLLQNGHEKIEPSSLNTQLSESGEWSISEDDFSSSSIREKARSKESGLSSLLHYDSYRRALLRDHFFPASTRMNDFSMNRATEWGDFINRKYTHRVRGAGIGTRTSISIALERSGIVTTPLGDTKVLLCKTVSLNSREPLLQVTYFIVNQGPYRISGRFGIENNWGLVGGNNPQAYYLINEVRPDRKPRLDQSATATEVKTVTLVNESLSIKVQQTVDIAATLWRFPIETVTNSIIGLERVYQCSTTLLHWPIDLLPDEKWQVKLAITIDKPE
jgi:hypothetical protein